MITSSRNPQVRRARKLSKTGLRDRSQQMLVEGMIATKEAIRSGARIETLFVTPSTASQTTDLGADVEIVEISDEAMRSISAATTPPGVIAICGFVDLPVDEVLQGDLALSVVVVGVRDPGNLGTILRTCVATGVDAVFLSADTVDVYNPKVVRSSAGAMFSLRFARDVDIESVLAHLDEKGISRIATHPRGSQIYYELDMDQPTALVLGNEASGLPEHVLAWVDQTARLPMAEGAESLNVAIAAAVFLFEAARQRGAR